MFLMFYCLEAVQLIDNQLVAFFIIEEYTDRYRRIYGLLSQNVRINIAKCTHFYLEIYGHLSRNIRINIEEYTHFYRKMYAYVSRNVLTTIAKYTDNYRKMYGCFFETLFLLLS